MSASRGKWFPFRGATAVTLGLLAEVGFFLCQALVQARAPLPVKNKADVVSDCDGVVRLIGVMLTRQEVEAVNPRERDQLLQTRKWIKVSLACLFVEEKQPEKLPDKQWLVFADDPSKKYRPHRTGEPLTPGTVRVGRQEIYFRKVKAGDRVEQGQTLVLMDPTETLDDLMIKVARLDTAEAERRAAEKVRLEARKYHESILAARRVVPKAVSDEEMREAEQACHRSLEKEIACRSAVCQAERALNAALVQLNLHEIRSPATGVIRKISKQRGEGARAGEPIIRIEFEGGEVPSDSSRDAL